jgi:hypothetical protein
VVWLETLAVAGAVAFALRVWLIVRPPLGGELPHPSKVAGMPMAGPASPAAAHAAINRKEI